MKSAKSKSVYAYYEDSVVYVKKDTLCHKGYTMEVVTYYFDEFEDSVFISLLARPVLKQVIIFYKGNQKMAEHENVTFFAKRDIAVGKAKYIADNTLIELGICYGKNGWVFTVVGYSGRNHSDMTGIYDSIGHELNIDYYDEFLDTTYVYRGSLTTPLEKYGIDLDTYLHRDRYRQKDIDCYP